MEKVQTLAQKRRQGAGASPGRTWPTGPLAQEIRRPIAVHASPVTRASDSWASCSQWPASRSGKIEGQPDVLGRPASSRPRGLNRALHAARNGQKLPSPHREIVFRTGHWRSLGNQRRAPAPPGSAPSRLAFAKTWEPSRRRCQIWPTRCIPSSRMVAQPNWRPLFAWQRQAVGVWTYPSRTVTAVSKHTANPNQDREIWQ